jgi:hypothetical protein
MICCKISLFSWQPPGATARAPHNYGLFVTFYFISNALFWQGHEGFSLLSLSAVFFSLKKAVSGRSRVCGAFVFIQISCLAGAGERRRKTRGANMEQSIWTGVAALKASGRRATWEGAAQKNTSIQL